MMLGDGIFEYKKCYTYLFRTITVLKITYMQLNGLLLIILVKVALEHNYRVRMGWFHEPEYYIIS